MLLLPLPSPSALQVSMSSLFAASALPSSCGTLSPMPAAALSFSSFLHYFDSGKV